MLLRDIVPCRCLARTHLQGQQLDMCKGQSSRSSFVEAGRAVPFAVDVVRFVMIKSVSAVASEWIRLQVSMGNQPTSQPANQPTAQAEQLPKQWVASPCSPLHVQRPYEDPYKYSSGVATTCKGGTAGHSKQNNSSPAPNPSIRTPHTPTLTWAAIGTPDHVSLILLVFYAMLSKVLPIWDRVARLRILLDTAFVNHWQWLQVTFVVLLLAFCPITAGDWHLLLRARNPGGVKVWFQASGWQKSWAGRKPSPVDTCDTYLQTLVFDKFLMYYTVFCLRFGSISFRQIVLLTSFANWMPLLQVSATSQRILLVQMLIFLCKSPYVLVMS